MEIVPTSIIAAVAVAIIALRGPYRSVWVLFAVLPMGSAAAFNLPALGGASILVSDMAALALFGMVVLGCGIPSILGSMRPYQPGFFLVIVLGLALILTALMPRLFAGAFEVFSIGRVDGEVGIVTRPLGPGAGNATQIFRLTLGVVIFLSLATISRLKPDPDRIVHAICCATVVNVALGVLDVATFAAGASWLMEPLRTANYAIVFEQQLLGIKRMVGGFPEASSFGYFSIGLCAFWLGYWLRGGQMRYGAWFALASVLVVLRSASTSAYVAFAVLCAFLSLRALMGLGSSRIDKRFVFLGVFGLGAVAIAVLSLFLAYQLQPGVTAYFDRLIFDKLESDSGVERMSWNVQAFSNFVDTYLLGAGLGSVRASNWFVATLASLGLVGTLFYLMFLLRIAGLSSRLARMGAAWAPSREASQNAATVHEGIAAARAMLLGCFALVVLALLIRATPNLGPLFFAMAGAATGYGRRLLGEEVSRPAVAPRTVDPAAAQPALETTTG